MIRKCYHAQEGTIAGGDSVRGFLFGIARHRILRSAGIVWLVLLFTGVTALAQVGQIDLHGDANAFSCSINDIGTGPITVYVFHNLTGGSQASRFRISTSASFTGVYVSEQFPPSFIAVGELATGVIISYSTCLTGSFAIAAIHFVGSGTSLPCSYLEVEPAPGRDAIEVADCVNGINTTATHGRLYVNPDLGCEEWCILATEGSTWGKIKALYR